MTAALEWLLPETRAVHVLALSLIVFVFGAGFAANYMLRAHDTVTVKVHKVEKSWGAPTQSVDGAQVNQAFTGLTCDVYESRSTVVCHP